MKPAVADYHTRVLCLRIEPVTGAAIRITAYPRNLTMSNGEVYLTGAGYDFTGYSATASLAPAMVDLSGIAGMAGIGADQLASGVFDGARCYLFATEWHTPVEDYEPIVASILGKTTLMDERYTIEEMALIDALNQSVGKTYTATCPKTFGGQEYAGCMVDLSLITVTGTLTAVTSSSIVRDSARTEDADWFAAGTLQFTSGANAGLKAQEVKIYSANGTIETWEPFYYAPQIGDTYSLVPGCRKRLLDCRDKWSNIINFGGYSYVPTGSQYSQPGTR
jgi:uncharacterized phage protein (TIGR02218 family)